MSQPAVRNRTDFIVHPQLLMDKDGERLCVIVKGTFELTLEPTRAFPELGSFEIAPADRRRGIRMADVPWEDPTKSSILFPADLCVRKPGTDVLFVGRAYAPQSRAVTSFDAGLKVGSVSKSVRIFGLRVWTGDGANFTSPRPISDIDMRYEFAWGGFDDSDPAKPVEEPRNPVGRGVVRDPASLTHQPLPHIEDPVTLISSHTTRPPPAGLGPIGRHWEPRRKRMGTYDAKWIADRAPLPPPDFDDRANQCASPGLTADPPLRGGEEGALSNLTPGGGGVSFALPSIAPVIEFHVKDRKPESFRPHLDTLILDAIPRPGRAPLTVEMVWRANVKAPRRAADAEVRVRETR